VATGGALTPDEQREALDRHLASSLAAFDAMLLKEQQAAAAQRAEHAQGSGASGAAGEDEGGGGAAGGGAASGAPGQRGAAKASGTGTATRGGERGHADSPAGGNEDDHSTGTARGDASQRAGGRSAESAPEGDPRAGDTATRPPPDVGDGRDDDVVARQLREAATNEKDPAIREKLWEEYRRYKKAPGDGS
jgi:hypothetical protein